MEDIQKLILSHAMFGVLFAFLVFIFRITSYLLPIMIVSCILVGHFSQKILKIRTYKVGGFIGWVFSGAIVFIIWFIFSLIVLYNIFPW